MHALFSSRIPILLAVTILAAFGPLSGLPALAVPSGSGATSASSADPLVLRPGTLVVSPQGDDKASGQVNAPLRTVSKALSAVKPGGVILLRGGVYSEQIMNPRIAAGTQTAPIEMAAYPGERPVIRGLLWLTQADYWTISNIEVTWASVNKSSHHMVKMTGGRGWKIRGSQLHGARSYAALLVAGNARDWTVQDNTIRDTFTSNGVNQDHLIYVNSTGSNGLIERNVLTNSPNGRAIKVGPPSKKSGSVTGGLVIRHNTMSDNLGPSNIQLAWKTSNVLIAENIMIRPGKNRSAVTAFDLTGTNNVVSKNLVAQGVRVADPAKGLIDGGGNVIVSTVSPVDRDRYGASAGRAVLTQMGSESTPEPTQAELAQIPNVDEVLPGDEAAHGISTFSASSAANGTANTLVLHAGSDVRQGDVLLASIAVRGSPRVTAPAGWVVVQNQQMSSTMRLVTFVTTVAGSGPAQHTFMFSSAQAAIGHLVALRGVDATSPVETSAIDVRTGTVVAVPRPVQPAQRLTGHLVTVAATPTDFDITAEGGMTEVARGTTGATRYRASLTTAAVSLAEVENGEHRWKAASSSNFMLQSVIFRATTT